MEDQLKNLAKVEGERDKTIRTLHFMIKIIEKLYVKYTANTILDEI